MKTLLTLLAILTSVFAFGQEDYVIRLNGKTYEISLDKNYDFKVDGKNINLMVSAKDTMVYNGGLYNFKYSKDYKISKVRIDEGIEQIVLMTAEGSGFLIQHYSILNPTMLNEMMLSEVTKESVSYGFEMSREDYSRTLKSGEKLNVLKAVLQYKDETSIYEVASYGEKDEGLIIMTMVTNEDLSQDGTKMIRLMWDSLNIKK